MRHLSSIVKKAFWSHLIPHPQRVSDFFKLSLSRSHWLIYREWATLYNFIRFRSHHFLYCNQQIVSHIYILESGNQSTSVLYQQIASHITHFSARQSLTSPHPTHSQWVMLHTPPYILSYLEQFVSNGTHTYYLQKSHCIIPMNDRQWEMLCFFWNGLHHIWDHHWQGVSVIKLFLKNYLIIILSYQSLSVAFCSLLKGSHHILPSNQ